MQRSFVRTSIALAAFAVLALPAAALADGETASSAGVGVARISLIRGPVALRRGDAPTATNAVVNAPVLGADYVTTGEDARAEIQFDAAAAVRLGANVQMRFTHLDANDRELQLAEGSVELRLLRAADGIVQIDTPSISIRPRTAGAYRVGVDAEGRTQVTVRSGRAEIVTRNLVEMLGPGVTLLAQGDASTPALRRVAAIADDDFDRFNAERDQRQERALAVADALPGVAGIDDLDAYGRWVSDASYGRVWVPSSVAPGWAPYRDGRWVWEDGYAWTWIGYEPWGWAPYHYGRWHHSAYHGWCWVPSRAVVAWSPALVSFVTFGRFDIGWVALAPFEPFSPWWGRGRTTIVNVTNVTNNVYYGNNGPPSNIGGEVRRHHHYRNSDYGGVTVVARRDFREGRFDRKVPVTPAKLRASEIVRGTLPMVPTDANLRFNERPVAAALAVRPALLQHAFAGSDTAARRVPIDEQRRVLTGTAHAVNVTPAVPPANATFTNVTPGAVQPHDPWSRFGAARGTPPGHVTVINGTTVTTAPKTGTVVDPWNRFDGASAPRRTMRANDATTRTLETTHATSVEPPRVYRERHDPVATPQQPAQQPVQRTVPATVVAPPPAAPSHPRQRTEQQHSERSGPSKRQT